MKPVRPNRAVNADGPVHVFNSASVRGGALVTLIRWYMDGAWLNAAKRLEYRDPRGFLVRIREIEPAVATSGLPQAVRALRTNSLKEWREAREAALFCIGMGERIGVPIYMAKSEDHDYDFVTSWAVNDVQHFAPVQLKEVVPSDIDSCASLQRTIHHLRGKYTSSPDLTVAIHLNQRVQFDFTTVCAEQLNIAALWVFGAVAPDQSQWGLWGDMLDEPFESRFAYPA